MKRYLVVDDDAPCRETLSAALSEYAACDSAENGRKGIEMYEQAILEGRPYDLVCSEICMAEMSGHDFIKKIREREDSQQPRIFVVSSSCSADDMSRALLNNDCEEYMLKPVRRESLNSILNKYKLIDNDNSH